MSEHAPPSLPDLVHCCEGGVPAVLATVAADGTPNVAYLSRVHLVDSERVALSNQFMSKSARNLVEVPHASLLLVDVLTHDEYRLALAYERTERRGPIFDRLRSEIDVLAAISGMTGVFRLRSADIFRVTEIERIEARLPPATEASGESSVRRTDLPAVAAVASRLSRTGDLDQLLVATVEAANTMLGFEHVYLMLYDAAEERLYTVTQAGFESKVAGPGHVGSEIALGDGMVGSAAQRGAPVRVGNVIQATKYAATMQTAYEAAGVGPGRKLAPPSLPAAGSRLVVPMHAAGELVGVLVAEALLPAAFDEADEAALHVVGAQAALGIAHLRSSGDDDLQSAPISTSETPITTSEGRVGSPVRGPSVSVRFFDADGSVFFDTDYVIKGVAGRLLWSLLRHYEASGRVEFSNKELRLDPTLELPEFRDNFESRLILLKRRLDERELPVRIERTGRGRFRLDVNAPLTLSAQ